MTPLTRWSASQEAPTLTGRGSVPTACAGAAATARPAPRRATEAASAPVRRRRDDIGGSFPLHEREAVRRPLLSTTAMSCEDVERQVLRLAAPGGARPTVAGQRRTSTGFPRPPTWWLALPRFRGPGERLTLPQLLEDELADPGGVRL